MICSVEQKNIELKKRIAELETEINNLKEQIRKMLVNNKKEQ